MESIRQPDEPDELMIRYGSSNYYEDVFKGLDYHDVKRFFNLLEYSKLRASRSCKYEFARQSFLKILGQQTMIWHPTGPNDRDVELSRLHREDRGDYLAILRIKPQGFRAERRVPSGVEITLHLLIGRVTLKRDKRLKILSRSNHSTIGPRSLYEITNIGRDQIAYLAIKITHRKKKHHGNTQILRIANY